MKNLIFFLLLILISILGLAIVSFTFAQGNSSQAPGKVVAESKSEKAIVGNVESIKPEKINVEEKGKGKSTEVSVDTSTKVVRQEGQKTQKGIKSLKPSDLVGIVATQSGKGKKALVIFAKDATVYAQLKRRAIQGIVLENNSGTLTIAHQTQRSRKNIVLTDSNTIVKFKSTIATASAIAVGDRIAAMGLPNSLGQILARLIHIIPGKASGILKKFPLATPTATSTATPSTQPATNSATTSANP
ncbi:hypothetical protein HYW39_00710 [Candidatus Curtissbacteria bacterium]|nr:hypothetical protein [Candidatus Curtissbacteria bacterium]